MRIRTLVLLSLLMVAPLAAPAADYTFSTTTEEDALLTLRATQTGATVAQLVTRACREGFRSVNQRYLEDRIQRLRERFMQIPEARRQAVEQAIEQALQP